MHEYVCVCVFTCAYLCSRARKKYVVFKAPRRCGSDGEAFSRARRTVVVLWLYTGSRRLINFTSVRRYLRGDHVLSLIFLPFPFLYAIFLSLKPTADLARRWRCCALLSSLALVRYFCGASISINALKRNRARVHVGLRLYFKQGLKFKFELLRSDDDSG